MQATATRPTLDLPDGWIKTVERATGRVRMVAVPSKSQPGKYHLVTTAGCDCKGYAFRNTCAHSRALKAILDQEKAPDVCGICDIVHRCHCPVMLAWCAACPPMGGYA